jgi:spore maturation protein SpmB
MRRPHFALLLVAVLVGTTILLPGPAAAAEEVSGIISVDTTWGPPTEYLVVSDTVVALGVTLTILPGTVVRFQTHPTDPDFNRSSLEVRGHLTAVGTVAEPIRFTSDHEEPTRGDWESIRVVSPGHAEIKYALIEYPRVAVEVIGASPVIAHSTLADIGFAGIEVAGEGSSPVVEDTLISSRPTDDDILLNQYHGAIIRDDAEATFRRMEFEENYIGILAWADTTVHLEDSRFFGNWHGVTAIGAEVHLRNNLFVENGFPGYGGTATTLISGASGTLVGNAYVNNGIGVSITRDSSAVVPRSQGNLVNGIPLEDIYYVNRQDEVIRDLVLDSGRSAGYRGNATFEGQLTLYDSTNLTFENVTASFGSSGVIAANSTFTMLNSTLVNVTSAVEMSSIVRTSFVNVAFDRGSVHITDEVSVLWVENFVRAQALNDVGSPVPDARVRVSYFGLTTDSATTMETGYSPWLRGIEGFFEKIPGILLTRFIQGQSSLTADHDSLIFKESTRALTLKEPETAVFISRDITPPRVTIYPSDGAVAVAPGTPVRLDFSEPMNTTSVEAAISVPGSHAVNLTWSFGDRTLTFEIAGMASAHFYYVEINDKAVDLTGNPLEKTTVSFETVRTTRVADLGQLALVALVIGFLASFFAALWWRRSPPRDTAWQEERGEGEQGETGGGEDRDGPVDRGPDEALRE